MVRTNVCIKTVIYFLQTNLVTEKADNYSQTKTLTVPVYRGESIEQLMPTFFVSVVTSDGKQSGLSKSECLYFSEKGKNNISSASKT